MTTAKKSAQRLGFKSGEAIVYPAHGVGRITAIEEQEIAGFKLELYVVSFDKDKMVLTPTYHVMEMYKVHQDATSLPIAVEAPTYSFGGQSVPAISASASVDAAGRTHVSLANMNPNQATNVTVNLSGVKASSVTGRILTAPAMDSRNTFDAPGAVTPAVFTGAKLSGAALTVAMPAKSVVVLELK